MAARQRLQLVLIAVSSIGYFPFSEWISTTRVGTWLFLWGPLIYLVPLLVAVLAAPVLIVCLIFQRIRSQAAFYLLVSLILVPCVITGAILGRKTRMAGMAAFAQRSAPLITAIQKYERDFSASPQSLDDLVPAYLPEVPSTGMMAYPGFEYHAGAGAAKQYAGNPWALTVFTPSGGINFDQMLYFPNQNYPTNGFGGWLERIGNWAYVHE